uniref:Putative membrane protein n=1 Tax=uncultured bacterium EIL27G07 TaxID=1768202 RepID=A0A0U2P225_9BACT|nr:putative membrane protein [uncultured bacterium EIL27G07]
MSKLHIFILGIIIFCFSLVLKLFIDLESKIVIFFNQFLFDLTFFSFLTEIGNGFFATAILVPCLTILSSQLKVNYVPVQLLIVPALCIGLDVQFLKYILSFERPASILADQIIFLEPIFIAGSFPSGHAATVLSVILIWLSFALKDLKSKKHKVIFSFFVLIALSVALTRVIIGAHWFSDILGSLALVLMAIAIFNINFVKTFIVNSISLKYFSFALIGLSWVGILFFDISDYL